MTVNLDVTSPESVKATVAKVIAERTRIDVLVNNAGVTRDGLAVRMKPLDWDLVLKINLTGAFLCAQAVLPGMMRNRWGRIVNIASVVGQAGSAGQANYAASKAGLIGFAKAVAQEVASRSITVNVVAPGLIETDMTKAITDKAQGDWAAQIPLGRLGTTADVAAAVPGLQPAQRQARHRQRVQPGDPREPFGVRRHRRRRRPGGGDRRDAGPESPLHHDRPVLRSVAGCAAVGSTILWLGELLKIVLRARQRLRRDRVTARRPTAPRLW